ncbi:MAG TPA: hypothetical protein DEP05_03180 [Betaproteobacteria bacterium]|nr:hypothetical protein [Betaproteobacteria bacterium]
MRLAQMDFDPMGRIVDFGVAGDRLAPLIDSGKPFQTSGCPGSSDPLVSACNRPFGDSPPSDIKSFPFSLSRADVKCVRKQLVNK